MNMVKKTTHDFSWPRFALDLFVDVVIVAALVLMIRTFLFAPFRVDGPSMCDTFNVYDGECFNGVGEHIITSRLATWNIFGWTPSVIDRGDVVVFQAPYGERGEFFIKRVIGMPGDTVKIEDGFVYLENEDGEFFLLEETYLSEENYGETHPYRVASESYTVPEGEYFVLGDNRTRSSDSRRCFQNLGCTGDRSPFLEHDLIQGEVKAVIFPFDHLRLIKRTKYSI